MRDIDAVVHQSPGIYVCKLCVDSPDLDNAILSIIPEDATHTDTFRFSIPMHAMMNLGNE